MKHGNTLRISASILAVAFLGACASGDYGPPPIATGTKAGGGTGTSDTSGGNGQKDIPGGIVASDNETISLVRYLGVGTNWPSTINQTSSASINQDGYSGFYTRVVILPSGTESVGNGDRRSYASERRGWFKRLLTEEARTVTAVAKVSVLEPDLPLTIPLYSVSYVSGGGDGDSWGTALTSSYVRSPLFLIGPNSRIAFNVSSKVSKDFNSGGLSTALSVVTSAVELAAPQTGLLTDLSSDENKQRAAALDNAISSLSSFSIDEDVELGRPISTWRPGAGVTITGCAPFVRSQNGGSASGSSKCATDTDMDGGINRHVGTWNLTLTCPQISVFSARNICDGTTKELVARDQIAPARATIAAQVSNSTVLELPLAENVTIWSHVRASDGFTVFLASSKSAADFGKYCGSTMSLMQGQGLNSFDAGLALRASLKMMPEFVEFRSKLQGGAEGANCRELMKDAGVTY
ncbi:hypothetical protein [Paraurantiacibacter namhicola]|uniref:Uncharacterized protein n=1 Tax=Paraurantiacibacter namhicola TaxID=645517 RepID=A0A1C7D8J9_9SPHN|nr:hypothetical protein [Paraurantiacibacter namhicola]ANU07767.1 hypothetical protein A6F65_01463 [Paraurantiacibacter namhicola]